MIFGVEPEPKMGMHIFFDTEFTRHSQQRAELISIGMVSQSGIEFYAELSDGWRLDDCSEFVLKEVVPLLEGGSSAVPLVELRILLKSWIESFGEPVELVTDSPDWDWPWITYIFPQEDDWPPNLKPKPLRYYVGELELKKERRFRSFRSHHALDDARLLYRGWRRAEWR